MLELFEKIGSTICHQIPVRSISINGVYLPLCARCTGIYLSMMITVFYLIGRKRGKGNKPLSFPQVLLAVLSFLPFMIDGVGSYLHFWQTNNLIRIVTGCFAGFSIPIFFILLLNFNAAEENKNPIIVSYWEEGFLLGASLLAGTLIYFGKIKFYSIISSIICMGVIFLYSHLFVLLFKLLFRKLSNRKIYGISFLFGIVFIYGISTIGR